MILHDQQRTALEQVDHIISVLTEVDRKFNIHTLPVRGLKLLHHLIHELHQFLLSGDAPAGDVFDIPADAALPEDAFRIRIMFQ